MKKFSQRELLDEGFWDGFKKVAGGALKGAGAAAAATGRLVDIALPEVTKPIKGAISTFRDVSNAAKKGWDTLRPKMEKIKQKLEEQGFILDETVPPQQSGNNSIVFAHKITGYDKDKKEFIWDKTKSTTFIVDAEGNVKTAPGGEKPVNNPKQQAPATPPPLPKPSAAPAPATPTPTPSATPKPQPRPISSPTSRKGKP